MALCNRLLGLKKVKNNFLLKISPHYKTNLQFSYSIPCNFLNFLLSDLGIDMYFGKHFQPHWKTISGVSKWGKSLSLKKKTRSLSLIKNRVEKGQFWTIFSIIYSLKEKTFCKATIIYHLEKWLVVCLLC